MSEKKYPWNKRWKKDSGAENEVYAGPEYFERQLSDELQMKEERRAMECVYAGPEYFKSQLPDEPQEEEECRPMEGVYAGPPIPPPMMCTYAGPEFYNGANTRQPVGAFAPAAAVSNNQRFCAACGSLVGDKDKFCTACGAALPCEEK